MPVTLINGFVVLPHPADWSVKPSWRRRWQTGVATALTGAERRQSLRNMGREQLSYGISALSLEERALLDERLDAATKSSLACCPFWGRGSQVVGDVTANTAVIVEPFWPFAVGDWVFLMDAFRNYDLLQVTEIQHPAPTADSDLVTADSAGFTADEEGIPTLMFSVNVSRTYPAGSLIWPMLFGKFSSDKETAGTSWHGDVKVTVTELKARHQLVIGTPPHGEGVGIGSWAVSSTFKVN